MLRKFYIRDAWGSYLVINSNGFLSRENGMRVTLWHNGQNNSLGVMTGASGVIDFSINGIQRQSGKYIFQILREEEADPRDYRNVFFKSDDNGLFLCQPEYSLAEVNRSLIGKWETFRLELHDELFSPHEVSACDLLLQARGASLNSSHLVQIMKAAPFDVLTLIVSDLINSLSNIALKILVEEMVRDKEFADLIIAALPEDIWTMRCLPANLSVCRSVPVDSNFSHCGREFDEFGNYQIYNTGLNNASSAMRLNSCLRAKVRPSKSLCVLAVARNEGVYLPEWIAYHKAIGVEHFYIYSNNNDDGSDELLETLSEAGIITYIRNDVGINIVPQIKAYTHALSCLPGILDYRWCAIIDIDEFIAVDRTQYNSFSDLLLYHEKLGSDAIALNWLMFTPSEKKSFQTSGLVKSFFYRQPAVDSHVKTVIRPGLFFTSSPHSPRTIEPNVRTFHNANGKQHADKFGAHADHTESPSDKGAWIAHYHLKSTQDFLWKMSRGTGMDPNVSSRVTIREDFINFFTNLFSNSGKMFDDRMTKQSRGMEIWLEHFSLLPNFKEVYDQCWNNYMVKTSKIKNEVSEAQSPYLRDLSKFL